MSILRADSIRDRAGTGAPDFPNGLTGTLTGNVTGTATTATLANTATVATNAQGLTGTPNITVGTVTGTDATFSGNLTVQGTTTTIDTAVTAVDSLAVDGNIGIGTTSPSMQDGNNNPVVHLYHATSPVEFRAQRGDGADAFFTARSQELQIGTNTNHRIEFRTNDTERIRITSTGEIGLSGANYGSAGQVLTSQGSGSAPQWASTSGGTSAGTRYTNPNTTTVEWTSLPANIQTIDVGYADSYASANNAENERIVLRLGTSAGYVTSNYNNRSWNAYASSISHGFSTTKSAFIPYYWIDSSDRATTMFTLRRMGTSNTFQAQWHEYITGGHTYMAMGAGYVDLGAELTQVRFQTINGNGTLNGSFWINYSTR